MVDMEKLAVRKKDQKDIGLGRGETKVGPLNYGGGATLTEEEHEALSKIIKEIRSRSRVGLREFCLTHGHDPSNWSKVERGVLPPPKDEGLLTEWAQQLGLKPGSEDWFKFFDFAAIDAGRIPAMCWKTKNWWANYRHFSAPSPARNPRRRISKPCSKSFVKATSPDGPETIPGTFHSEGLDLERSGRASRQVRFRRETPDQCAGHGLFSRRLSEEQAEVLGLTANRPIQFRWVSPVHITYLDWHRRHVFQPYPKTMKTQKPPHIDAKAARKALKQKGVAFPKDDATMDDEALDILVKGPIELLDLSEYQTLTDHQAELISRFSGRYLALGNLRKLTPATADAISSTTSAWVNLYELRELTERFLVDFSRHPRFEIILNSIKSLPHCDYKALKPWNVESVSLLKLSQLSTDQAKWLFDGTKEDLYLYALRTIDSSVAAVISKWKGRTLWLSDLSHLKPRAAKLISQWKGKELRIAQLETFSKQTASALSDWRGNPLFLGVSELSTDAARCLARWKGKQLEISGLKTLSAAASKALASWNGHHLHLKIEKLSKEAATGLAQWEGEKFKLSGRCRLTAASAQQLAKSKVRRIIFELRSMPNKSCLRALSRWKGKEMELRLPKCLDVGQAKALAAWGGKYLEIGGDSNSELFGPESADLAAIEALFNWKGDMLSMQGPSRITEAIAQIIAASPPKHLMFFNIQGADRKACEILKTWQGVINSIEDKSQIFRILNSDCPMEF